MCRFSEENERIRIFLPSRDLRSFTLGSCCLSVSIFSVFKHAAWRWLLSENKISFLKYILIFSFEKFFLLFLSMHCGISIAILWLSTIPPHNIWGQTEKVASPINIHQLVVTKFPFRIDARRLIHCVIGFVQFACVGIHAIFQVQYAHPNYA